ncbi:PAS domain S-box protein [Planktothrix sp. FACHB-1355]|uniref:Circadian input-output histidine kinase CikA n=1 Tax=Aerosakkonema funiforme FACHB-1375 TaxID=2949571 RepID=A0A926VFI9_9CYAN|nr:MULTISPECIES: PAS domain S-box protein [Oscillatoriales]MBD2182944.1 PAS domain S-box protein [Aerosakkonema funiforme FACHB-1375]MBD3559948.1 PAS domain S-box protein [Planktothrix sp. FACHB-1355]
MQNAVHNIHYSLALLAEYPNASKREKKQYLSRVASNQKKMKEWVYDNPNKFKHKYDLVEAEIARVLGQNERANEYYQLAIQEASQNGYIQEEALANELAAEFYLSLGIKKVGEFYLTQSYYTYIRCGAKAKVKDLEERYPEFFSSLVHRETISKDVAMTAAPTMGNSSAELHLVTLTKTSQSISTKGYESVLDISTVMKACQALVGEVVLDNLLAKLMLIVMENAGAESGFLILNREGKLLIEASGNMAKNEVKVRQSMPVTSSDILPVSAINYVSRSQSYVVLNDARTDGKFSNDPYIIAHQSKSVLCTPILGQGKLIGILYLENSLTTGAFTPARLEILKLLCSQAAICLENAQLYEAQKEYAQTLEIKVQERTQELQQEIIVRKQTELALRVEQEKFAKAFLSSPNPIAITNFSDGTYIDVNDSFSSIFGYSRSEVSGHTVLEMNILANPEEFNKYKQLLQVDGKIRNQELNVRTKSGDIRTILLSSDRIDLGGEVYILSVMNDITDRKRAEDALRQSEERYRAVVEDQTELVCRFKPDGTLTFVNDAYCRYFNAKRSELIGHSFEGLVPEEDKINIAQLLASLNSDNPIGTIEHRVLFGKVQRWHQWTDRAIFDEAGNFIEFQGVGRDITDRKQAEDALRESEAKFKKAKEAADAANRAKSEFLSKMSHELRTPLNAILGFTQVLARGSSLTKQQQEHLGIINRSGEHLLTLINDVLEMSKIEAGRIELHEHSFDLFRLLDTLAEMFQLKAESKRLQLIFERSQDIPQYVKTDESKLRQVLINLLGNAIKFTEKGRVILRASLAEKRIGETTIQFQVEDTGPGIAAEELPTLFDPFVQTETGKKSQSGTGLGLPISRQFIQLMGGDITVSSRLGKGTIFQFNIQIKLAEATEVPNQTLSQKVIGLAADQPQYRILVVDDKSEGRLLLFNLLSPLGFQVEEAANGAEAIAIWENWRPHLIWMDMQMPVMDGYEATKQIKAIQKSYSEEGNHYSECPVPPPVVIALTASAFAENRATVLAAGCDDFVSRPFREEVIFSKMSEYLGVRYVYEESAVKQKLQIPKQTTSWQLSSEDLAAMPKEWIVQLYQAAKALDEDKIVQLSEQIKNLDARLANSLVELAKKVRFDKITDLIEQINHD